MNLEKRNRKIMAMADGTRSSSVIAAVCGVTRNVVIGIVQRARKAGLDDVKLPPLGQRRRPGEIFPGTKPKARRKGGQSQVLRVGQRGAPKPPDQTPLRQADVVPRGPMVCDDIPDSGLCRYIHGGNPDIGRGIWCGHPVSGDGWLGRAYCAAHRDLCTRAAPMAKAEPVRRRA